MLNYKNTLVKLMNIRVSVGDGGQKSTLLSEIDFNVEMPILKTTGYALKSGWFFDQDYRQQLQVYIFQVDAPAKYKMLKAYTNEELAKILYEFKNEFQYRVVSAPNLSEEQVRSLGFYSDPQDRYIYKIPFKVDKPFLVDSAASTLTYFFLPLVDQGNNITFKGVACKEVFLNNKMVEMTEV